ncbi:hypothetical protein BDFB_009694, partial [Asbolus verrucosus]
PRHRAARLEYCTKRRHLTYKWYQIIFSDKYWHCLWAHDGRKKVRRQRIGHNVRLHTVYNQVTLLPWPSRSPDLSPLEHIWDIIDVKIGNLQRLPNNLVKLRHLNQE